MSNIDILLRDSKLYLPKDSPLAMAAMSTLQYKLPKPTKANPLGLVKFYEEDENNLLVPRHYIDYLKENNFSIEVEQRYIGPDRFPMLSGGCSIVPWGKTEREYLAQKDAIDFLNTYGIDPPSSDAIVSLPCGIGKTYIAIRAMYDYGYQTLIVAHTTDILNNWKEDLQKTSEGDAIGEVISGRYNLQPITLGLIQSILSLEDYQRQELSEKFGLIIFDEMHHLSAQVFSKVSNSFSGRRIGLSATLAREDGMAWVYYMSLGSRIFLRDVPRKKARIRFKKVRVQDVDIPEHPSKALSALADSEKYLRVLEKDIRESYERGEKQLIVSARKSLLFLLEERLSDLSPGVNTQETPADDRHRNLRTKRVILSVHTFATEGLNEPSLNVLRVITPLKDRNAVKQMVGRLERYEHDEDAVAIFYAPLAVHFPHTLEKAKANLVREGYFIEREDIE